MATPTTTYTVADLFQNADPSVKKLYDKLMNLVRKLGPVTESPKKTCIHLDNNSGFAGVFVRKNYINLNLRTDYEIDSPRIAKTEQVSKSRFHNLIKLESEADLDKEFQKWLCDAYALSK